MVGIEDIVSDLTLRNRAYQVRYALGETPETVDTLEPGEAERWIQLAREVEAGDRSTGYHQQLAAAMNPNMLRYVTTGRM